MPGNGTLIAGKGHVMKTSGRVTLGFQNDPRNQIWRYWCRETELWAVTSTNNLGDIPLLHSAVTVCSCQIAGSLPECEADGWAGHDSPHPQRHGEGEGPSEWNGNSAHRPRGGNRGSGTEFLRWTRQQGKWMLRDLISQEWAVGGWINYISLREGVLMV